MAENSWVLGCEIGMLMMRGGQGMGEDVGAGEGAGTSGGYSDIPRRLREIKGL